MLDKFTGTFEFDEQSKSGPHCVMKRDKRKNVRIKTCVNCWVNDFSRLLPNPTPVSDPEVPKFVCFFAIIDGKNFLGFRNRYPEVHDPSWF